MESWQWGLVVVLVLGIALVAYGVIGDGVRRRDVDRQLHAPPDRPIPRFTPAEAAPRYLTELQARTRPGDADSLSAAERERLRALQDAAGTVQVAAGWASTDFVTDSATGWAVLTDADVLVCADPVTTVRELLPTLEYAIARRGLVVVAPELHPEVRGTLEVNALQRTLPLLAVLADGGTAATVAERCGATPVERRDLMSGAVPGAHLGSVQQWVSDRRRSWLVPNATTVGHPDR